MDSPFISNSGEPFKVFESEDGQTYTELKTSQMILAVLNLYQPNPSMGHVLWEEDLRRFNEVAKCLEEENPRHGYYIITPEQFNVVRKVCLWRMPVMGTGWARNLEHLLAALDGLPTEEPILEDVEEVASELIKSISPLEE